MSQRPIPALAAALSYAKFGWQIVPCHSPMRLGECGCGDSNCLLSPHPLFADGADGATSDIDVIFEWWTTHPDAVIAVRLGRPNGMCVVRRQGPHNAEEARIGHEWAAALPKGADAITGFGDHHHFFYVHPERRDTLPIGKLDIGIELLGNGALVVVPNDIDFGLSSCRWNGDPRLIPYVPQWLNKRRTPPTLTDVRAAPQKPIQHGRHDMLIIPEWAVFG